MTLAFRIDKKALASVCYDIRVSQFNYFLVELGGVIIDDQIIQDLILELKMIFFDFLNWSGKILRLDWGKVSG